MHRSNSIASALCTWLNHKAILTSFLALCLATLLLSLAAAQEAPQSSSAAQELPDLTIPQNANAGQLQAIIGKAKQIQPKSGPQYQAMQTAIRDAGRKLLTQLSGKKDSPEYRQAELDVITSSIALMTFAGPEARQKTLDQILEFLKSRKTLSLSDVQTGMMAAAMLELQPNKRPARSVYELLDELLEEDEREEMQSLRINLQANVRRLALLGSEMKLTAKTIDGKTVRISDYAGKFLIIDFFATWCKPCLEEAPRLKGHYAKYRSKGLEVLGISLDQDRKQLNQYLKNANLPWPIIHDSEENPLKTLQIKFGISQLPTVLLLNKEGTVVSLEARGAELDRLMQMLFDAPTPAPAKASEATDN